VPVGNTSTCQSCTDEDLEIRTVCCQTLPQREYEACLVLLMLVVTVPCTTILPSCLRCAPFDAWDQVWQNVPWIAPYPSICCWANISELWVNTKLCMSSTGYIRFEVTQA
jgi:hypothetical protein